MQDTNESSANKYLQKMKKNHHYPTLSLPVKVGEGNEWKAEQYQSCNTQAMQ